LDAPPAFFQEAGFAYTRTSLDKLGETVKKSCFLSNVHEIQASPYEDFGNLAPQQLPKAKAYKISKIKELKKSLASFPDTVGMLVVCDQHKTVFWELYGTSSLFTQFRALQAEKIMDFIFWHGFQPASGRGKAEISRKDLMKHLQTQMDDRNYGWNVNVDIGLPKDQRYKIRLLNIASLTGFSCFVGNELLHLYLTN
jgi:hypothetical protein